MNENKQFVAKEVEKILHDPAWPFPLNVAMSGIWLIANLKGTNLKVLDLSNLSPLADYFILASASNPVQAYAMADDISEHLKKQGHPVKSREGSKESDWILLDLGDVIIHIFQEGSRQLYDLDGLWAKAKQVPIPESYYFPSSEEIPATPAKSDSKEYYY